jgi:hypothetical protein
MKAQLLAAFTFITIGSIAQTDSVIIKKQDTIKIGNMLIVGGNADSSNRKENNVNIVIDAKGKRSQKNGVTIYGMNDTLVAITDDTVKVGRLKIINKSEGSSSYGQKNWESFLDGDFKKTKISFERAPKKLKPITTNWWIFDLGFANLVDHTEPLLYAQTMYLPYPGYVMPNPTPNSSDLKLNNEKSSNVNIWIVQQKANIYKHYWNLKYGIGFEMYNFRFKQPISFSNTTGNNIYFDNAHFTKNKLFVEYLTVPVQLNYQANPNNNKSFYASIGMSAGYLIQSHTKQISDERGKRKMNGNFNLNNFKMATIGELGIGSIRLYTSYNISNMFDEKLTHFDMAPFAVGVRFSKF